MSHVLSFFLVSALLLGFGTASDAPLVNIARCIWAGFLYLFVALAIDAGTKEPTPRRPTAGSEK